MTEQTEKVFAFDNAHTDVVGAEESPTANDDRVAALEARVAFLYEALDSQITYHGSRNGPVAHPTTEG
jgi:hypothetical protein